LTYAFMLVSLIVYAQFVMVLIDMLIQWTYVVCVARLPQSYQNELYQILRMCVSYIFIALEVNKYIV
jgi:hypothetical protein